jgi:DNA-directed DNA polymerase III PolC
MTYAALHNHSYYSLLDSAMSVGQLVDAAREHHITGVGLVDRDTLAGAVEFYKRARSAGLHAVIGSEVTLSGGGTLVLLVENAAGYANLCRLISTRVEHTDGVTLDDVARYSAGLLCLTSSADEPFLLGLREMFDARLALEVSPHTEEDLRRARAMGRLSRRHRIPLVATAGAHYRAPEDRLRYDILASMRTLTLLGQPHPMKLGAGNYHLHTPAEMERHFAELPQAIANTARIAERCRFDFELGDILFPEFKTPDGETPTAALRRMARSGVERRYAHLADRGEVYARLDRELRVIEEVGYAEYFLIFADIVEWANRNGIATLARGSAAGSLVCYALAIGNVCPFRFGLSFERFLNKERMQFAKLADIDLDLPWDRRDEVVRYVFERYGEEHVACIGAFNTFQGRSSVADIAKVYGIPEREARRFTEHLPYFAGDADAVVREIPECRHLPYNEEPYRTILKMTAALEGVPRHFMMHPCGLVIGAAPITSRMPVFRSAKGLLTTHYAMDDVEELGLLKMDLLGQAGLSVLRDARAAIRANRGVEIDAASIDQGDPATWEAISSGNARGVFHIESPAMTSLLVMANCRDIDCLTAVESIIRPGAANEGKKRAFARRHQGFEPVSYVHPSLEPLLADTYGLMAYEEHILLVANGFAGMPWGRADLLRRALVKNKDRRKIAELGAEFRARALDGGRAVEEIEAVWKMLEAFAGYMFNKAHSAAYAVEAFEGAYLKTRYPIEFLAAVLGNRRGFYAPIVYVLEALRCGARFLPPDVNLSAERFLVRDETIRLPLDQIKGLDQATVARIRAARDEAPFGDTGDFYRRVRPRHAEWIALVKTGAFDSLGEPRGRVFWRLCRLEAAAARLELFEAETSEDLPSGAGANPQWEHELLGFPVSCHPLDYFARGVEWTRYVRTGSLIGYLGKEVEVCGLIVTERVHTTDRGAMKFLTLADYEGFVEVALFADTYRNYGHLTTQPVVAVRAVVDAFENRRGYVLRADCVRAPRRKP